MKRIWLTSLMLFSLQAMALPPLLEFDGKLEKSTYTFEFFRVNADYHLCMNKTQPKLARAFCVLAKMDKSETYGYDNNLDCRYQGNKIFVFFARAKYKPKQKFNPTKAWIFNLKLDKIFKLNPKDVKCVYAPSV